MTENLDCEHAWVRLGTDYGKIVDHGSWKGRAFWTVSQCSICKAILRHDYDEYSGDDMEQRGWTGA